MREILFRGKQEEGRWVEGVYFKHDTVKVCFSSDDPKPRHLIIQDGFCDWGFEPPIHCVDVDPATVGQFTGLTDKNGKRIFEGDIIQYSIEEDQAVFVGAVKFGEFNPDGGALLNTNVGFSVEMVDQEGKRTYMRKDIGFWVKFRQVEVIGNIHDNPKLLEVTDNA